MWPFAPGIEKLCVQANAHDPDDGERPMARCRNASCRRRDSTRHRQAFAGIQPARQQESEHGGEAGADQARGQLAGAEGEAAWRRACARDVAMVCMLWPALVDAWTDANP